MNKQIIFGLFLSLIILSCGEKVKEEVPIPVELPALTASKPVQIEAIPILADRDELLAPIYKSIEAQKKEKLIFDEPRTEWGLQLDGKLRPAWEQAYMQGKIIYIFNGDRYGTIGKNSAPFVPQVCADFIVDTLDRAAGTWYRPSLKNPGRYVGKRDIRKEISQAGYVPRRVSDLVMFFNSRPDEFEFIYVGRSPVAMGQISEMKQWLFEMGVQKGDIIFINGKVPWDRGKELHNHSFFVTGYDDKGMPHLVTGNPVYPVERTIKTEGKRTPLRRVTHIIRLSDKFLKSLL